MQIHLSPSQLVDQDSAVHAQLNDGHLFLLLTFLMGELEIQTHELLIRRHASLHAFEQIEGFLYLPNVVGVNHLYLRGAMGDILRLLRTDFDFVHGGAETKKVN